MGDHPRGLTEKRRLFDGTEVTIRPIRKDDAAMEGEFLRGLSDESRYLRFQKWVRAPSEKLVHFLTDIDYDRQMALVCVAAGPRGEEVVGEARYAVNPDGRSCEFGIMIADDWHNSGIAGLLMEALMRDAQARGLAVMEGQVLAVNRKMLRFARGLGFSIQPMPDDIRTFRVVRNL